MARTVKDARLETRAARQRLAISGVPYYRSLDPNVHIGYRRGASGGRWVLRWYRGEGGYKVETIGTADDKADADGVAVLSFAQAQALCRERHVAHTRVARGMPAKASGPFTVGDAIEGYLTYLDSKRASPTRMRGGAPRR